MSEDRGKASGSAARAASTGNVEVVRTFFQLWGDGELNATAVENWLSDLRNRSDCGEFVAIVTIVAVAGTRAGTRGGLS